MHRDPNVRCLLDKPTEVLNAPCIFESTKTCSTMSIDMARDGTQGLESRSRWRKAVLGGTSSQLLPSVSEGTNGKGVAGMQDVELIDR